MTKLLEQAIAKVRALLEQQQEVAARLLLAFANPEADGYQLTDDQLAEVELAKREVREGYGAQDRDRNRHQDEV